MDQPKIIQICVATENEEHYDRIFGLGEDGKIYQWRVGLEKWFVYSTKEA